MSAPATLLEEHEWRVAGSRHRARVEPWVAPRRARRQRAESHPVDDFLFDYYPYSIAKLSSWHPGYGTALLGDASEYLGHAHYVQTADGVTVDPSGVNRQRLAMVLRLLSTTSDRQPQLGCFGMHEWAMVHGLDEHDVRHGSVALRLAPTEIAQVVEEVGLRCTHIDAYRFFTPTSTPMNAHVPTRADQHEWDQPGCLHANMDLYKYAMWFAPFVASELVADCFELARSARNLDMRAAPYDLGDYGYEAVRIETAEGRREYVDAQRAIMLTSTSLRSRLLASLQLLDEGSR